MEQAYSDEFKASLATWKYQILDYKYNIDKTNNVAEVGFRVGESMSKKAWGPLVFNSKNFRQSNSIRN